MSKIKYRNLMRMVDEFAKEMKRKLRKKSRAGWYGWKDTGDHWPDQCRAKLAAHIVNDGDPIDVANFAAFLWNLGERTSMGSEQ